MKQIKCYCNRCSINLGIEKIIELGSGRVLTGIAKRMLENVSAKSYENPEDFEVLV